MGDKQPLIMVNTNKHRQTARLFINSMRSCYNQQKLDYKKSARTKHLSMSIKMAAIRAPPPPKMQPKHQDASWWLAAVSLIDPASSTLGDGTNFELQLQFDIFESGAVWTFVTSELQSVGAAASFIKQNQRWFKSFISPQIQE